ncbi:MAG: hypothetical protein ACREOO_09300 [bacterium]
MKRDLKQCNRIFSSLFVTGYMFCLLLSACDSNNGAGPGTASQIQGSVVGGNGLAKMTAGTGIQGATVVVAQLQNDGSLQTVSNDTVQTDANGNFTVATALDNQSNLIVVANRDSNTWRAVVSATARNGATVTCQPLTYESTLEADVYSQILASGNASQALYADIQTAINAQVAANVKGNAAAVATLAGAIVAGVDAQNSLLLDASLGASSAQISSANNVRQQAQIALEASLYAAAENQPAIIAALEAYNLAEVNAYVASGIGAAAYAKSYEAKTQANARQSVTLNAIARFALKQKMASLKARVVSTAVLAQLSGFGAANARLVAATNAGVLLRSATDSAATDQDLAAAWQAYHDAIVGELQATVNTQSAAILTIDTSLNAIGGARLILNASLSVAASTQLLVNAYSTFYGAVRVLAQTTLSGASTAEIQLIAETLTLINMYS